MTILSSFCARNDINSTFKQNFIIFLQSLSSNNQNTVSNIFLGQQKISDSIVGSKGGSLVATTPPLSPGLYQQMQFIAYKVTIIRAANITTELLFLLVMPFPRDSPGKIILHMDHQVNNYVPIFLSCNIKVTFNLLKEQFQ